MKTNRLAARAHLGVCPQFNTTDRMTVAEHLKFYARIRGVPDAGKNVDAVMEAVGLTQYRNRRTAKLSGGNHRKLSLASAIVGNPTTILLDEPSSGMDPLAAGIMQQAIQAVSPNRAVVITTHSMEEASALAHRAAILDSKILTIGSPEELRERHGKGVYELHVVYENDQVLSERMQRLRDWVIGNHPGAVLLSKSANALHGQDRFQVAVQSDGVASTSGRETPGSIPRSSLSQNHLIRFMKLLEESKQYFGVQYYSISRMTLEDVFLEIVSRNRRIA